MKWSRIAYNAIGGVSGLIAASAMTFQSANAQQSSSEIARQVVNADVQSIIQSVRDQIQMQSGTAVPGTAGLMRFTAERGGDAVYQEAFGALAYAKEPLLTKAPLAPAAPSLLWGFTATGTIDSQSSSVSGVAGNSVATTEVALGAIDVTKIGIFGAKDALNLLVVGSVAFTSAAGLHTTTPGVAVATTYINGPFSSDFIFNTSFSHTGGLPVNADVTAYSYTTDFNYRYDYANHWWFEPTIGMTHAEAYSNGNFVGQSWTIQGGGRVGTEVLLENGVKLQPTFTALAYSNFAESGAQFSFNGQNGQTVVGGDQGQLWGRGAAKFNFIFAPNFSAYVEGYLRGTTGELTTIGYGGNLGVRWTW